MIIRMLSMPVIESPKALIIIFMFKFLEIILSGRNALNNLIILRLTVFGVHKSITIVTTMIKSNFYQLL